MKKAREDAEFEVCRSRVAEIRSSIELKRARCLQAVAAQNACLARNEKTAAENGILGCLVGIAIAAGSAGAATPIALGGCGVGLERGKAMAAMCPAPACDIANLALTREVLHERKLDEIPMCGGYVGLAMEQREEAFPIGIPVAKVAPNTTADALALLSGDVVVGMNGSMFTDPEGHSRELERSTVGKPIEVVIVRERTKHVLHGIARNVRPDGLLNRTPLLGVYVEPARNNVPYFGALTVTNVAASSPAEQADLRVGDMVAEAEGKAVSTSDDVADAVRDRPAGQSLLFRVIRGGRSISVTVQSRPRRGELGI